MAKHKTRLIIAACLVLAAATVLLVYQPIARFLSPRPDRPVIKLSTAHLNFGRLKPGQEVRATVTIENAGGRTLELEAPTATCGCQTPLLERKTLGPGEKTNLLLRQVAAPQIGPFRHMVFLKSNDPEKPQADVYLDGTVSKGVIVRPEPLVFDAMRPGESRTRYLEIASDEGKSFRITYLNAFGPVQAIGTVDVPSEVHKIEVTATAGKDLGEFEGTIVTNLDIPGNPPLMIPVRGTVNGPYRITPSSLDLGVIPGHSEMSKSILVGSTTGRAVSIGKLGELPAGWSLESSLTSKDGTLHVVKLKIKVPDFPGPARAALRLEVASEGGAPDAVEIPITAVITKEIAKN